MDDYTCVRRAENNKAKCEQASTTQMHFINHRLVDNIVICSWNEWLTLPINYSDLPRNALLAFTIWDIYGPNRAVPVGGTTISLFGKHG